MSRNGIFVAVVGPSGAGKDTLLNGAAAALAGREDMHFVRRVITREPDGMTEDHDTLSTDAFAAAKAHGEFCLTWGAHGLHYGLPLTARKAVERGAAAVANVSRGVLGEALAAFGRLAVIEITADPAVLAQRIAGRGRESEEEIRARLLRQVALDIPLGADAHIRIRNDGALEDGVAALIDAIARAGNTHPTRLGHFAS